MNANTASTLTMVRDELNHLGYVGNLIQEDYAFDDASNAGTQELRIPVATFAQWPPSYRNACIGVLLANGQTGPQHVAVYNALGAPMFFEIFEDCVNRFQITANGQAIFLESVPVQHLRRSFDLNRNNWSPEAIFRAKAIAPLRDAIQLDFIDIGLLPALKGKIHKKLDRLLNEILNEAVKTYKRHSAGRDLDATSLFRLVFRCLAAKIFNDRKHPGDWSLVNAKHIIDKVQQFYWIEDFKSARILDEPNTQQVVWDKFRRAFNFQNISVDDLAFIYENTLIQEKTRRQFGIHSTPSILSDLIVDRLPFESLPQADRYVLEPCAGHGAFLITALRRLRELLPSSWTSEEKHTYLKDHITAIEMDTFAAEVCRLSLTLADYPNPNGWKIFFDDVFSTDVIARQMKRGRIVLCNPPFEDFTPAERERYGQKILSTHKPYEVLRRVLSDPPAMLGFVLPKSAIIGSRYDSLQDKIARTYKSIETIALPDRVFAFSDQETMLVLASERKDSTQTRVFTRTFWVRDNDRLSLLEKGKLPDEVSNDADYSASNRSFRIWNPFLYELWDYLEHYPRLRDVAEIHRGIEWNISLKENRDILISSIKIPGFVKGLDTANRKIEPYYVRGLVYLNVDQQYMRTTAHSFAWDKPKVIANSRRMSRNPWRIVGYPDSDGLVCYKNFFGIWSKSVINIEVLSCLINSPLINAAIFSQSYGRDIPVNNLEQIPVPFPNSIDHAQITELVKLYHAYRLDIENTINKEAAVRKCIRTLMNIDALILKAYDLSPKLERKLLEFFRGYKRPLPFEFPDYYPESFKPYVPLYKFIEMDFKQASAGELLKRITPLDSEEIHDFVLTLDKK